ncbi:A/G-specific adenine glycosylase [Desulfotalea psychrophila]|uniref:Adenine DNA glycosylase n=1 Tax=Desulfotalea psychrophila (strain LSv54 / DSM 12343) TaxID=177439 RepID=Q6AKD3_DESPS|nr:A/G-specific adenine glycosylase [Desulfotalea psychrophila]CAG37192.1 related to A/G-specific adenine glycosylase [Desulfotalea psychrophila LSv54]
MTDYSLGADLDRFQSQLLTWFRLQDRFLPWRQTYDPYHVWISEIMLQQTQMDRGVSYFNRWIERFPQVEAVAEADEQEIFKMWEGLGYYARARNLHRAAKKIVEEFAGELPCDIDLLRSLPGIGPYTAAAIGSVACNIDIPTIDANVARIFSRLFDIDRPVRETQVARAIEKVACDCLPSGRARHWNQALMDLGGLVCLPRAPRCTLCPIQEMCLAFARQTVQLRPVPLPKQKLIHIRRVAIFQVSEGRLLIQPSRHPTLWQGLWEFPHTDLQEEEAVEVGITRLLGLLPSENRVLEPMVTVKHAYTKYRVQFHCYLLRGEAGCQGEEQRLCDWQALARHGFSAGPRKVLEHIEKSRQDIVRLLGA